MSTIQAFDPMGLRGDLAIIRRDAATGRLLSTWEKKNVIVYGAGTALTRLIAPNAAFGATIQEESQIKSMRFGGDNVAPQRTDTALGDPLLAIELTDADRVHSSSMVEFVAVMDSLTGNGNTYREAALYTRGTADDPNTTTGALMYSRQIFPDQPKTALVELEFRWRITFTF